MASIIGDYEEAILTNPMPMSSEELFYDGKPETRREVYEAAGAYIDAQITNGFTFSEFDVILGLTASRTVRYRCNVAYDPTVWLDVIDPFCVEAS